MSKYKPFMSQYLQSRFFPPAEWADENGLVFIGGKLSPEWLLDAYRHGIFPWPLMAEFPDMLWWSPDPRAIFEYDSFYVSKRLERTIRSKKFRVTSDLVFAEVLHGCANAQHRTNQTWLTEELQVAYIEMHRLGYAHSIEVWQNDRLVGGTYGLAIGGLFAAESMFHYETDASKIAVTAMIRHLKKQGYVLVDIQQTTDHTKSLGAREIPRRVYLNRLQAAIKLPVKFGAVTSAEVNRLEN